MPMLFRASSTIGVTSSLQIEAFFHLLSMTSRPIYGGAITKRQAHYLKARMDKVLEVEFMDGFDPPTTIY
jgi:hypothetical protein|tara:strand:- start:553 stop:762 length:210 start_codon:yes stop_codon:yes gene_type:complete